MNYNINNDFCNRETAKDIIDFCLEFGEPFSYKPTEKWDCRRMYDEEFKKRMIPLLGFDGNYYTNYLDWETTFPHTRIIDEFPETFNGHPTILQHQYLAKSIINHLDGKQ